MASIPPPGPALPWARVEPSAAAAEAAQANKGELSQLTHTLEEIQMDIGARIEVRWEIEEDENITLKWWGATIDNVPSASNLPEEQRRKSKIFLLRYDAFEDFEAEDREVMFFSDKELLDIETANSLRWRKEGEEGGDESDEEDDNMEEEQDVADAQGYTLQELVQAAEEMEPEGDNSVTNIEMPDITPFQERLVASHLNDLIGGFMAHIQASKTEGSVITADDVREYFKDKRPPEP